MFATIAQLIVSLCCGTIQATPGLPPLRAQNHPVFTNAIFDPNDSWFWNENSCLGIERTDVDTVVDHVDLMQTALHRVTRSLPNLRMPMYAVQLLVLVAPWYISYPSSSIGIEFIVIRDIALILLHCETILCSLSAFQ